MLVVTRKIDESLIIAENIEITILDISKDRVKLGISAPRDVQIIRNELIAAQNANRESSEAVSKDVINALLSNMRNSNSQPK